MTWDIVTVDPGEIRISSVLLLRREENCAWFSVDCATKRPAVMSCGSSDEEGLLYLDADEETLRIDEARKGQPTALRFAGFGHDWRMVAEAGRYTVDVMFVRKAPDDEWARVWSDAP